MRYWLMKSEPSEFSIDDFAGAPGKSTSWFGVRNYMARNFMRDQMQLGDQAFGVAAQNGERRFEFMRCVGREIACLAKTFVKANLQISVDGCQAIELPVSGIGVVGGVEVVG